MKRFSFTCRNEISQYEKSIVPILRWMINLEELCLNICIYQGVVFGGNQLKTNILNHLSKLNKFTFNIRSLCYISNLAAFVSNEDIQNSFIGLGINEIVSYVDYSSTRRDAVHCHMFSYPYTLEYFDGIRNRFPDGLYECVREVKLFDNHPFEYEFFLRMAKAFPFVELLTLTNRSAQQQKSIGNDRGLAPIEYSHLSELYFNGAHDDYIEQFLMDSKTFLSKSIRLYIERKDLKRVTHNFTRITTEINCAKVYYLHLLDNCRLEPGLTKYFPSATMAR